MSRQHITEDLMDRYAMGALEGEVLAEVEEHLLECPACQGMLTDTDEFLNVFRAAAVQTDARPAVARRAFWPVGRGAWATMTAGAALAAGTAFMVLTGMPRPAANLPPVSVEMQSLRGPEAGMHVVADRPLQLVFDVILRDAVSHYEIELVDADGGEVLRTGAALKDGKLAAQVGKLTRGAYWVRVYSREPVRDLLAEYGLKAE